MKPIAPNAVARGASDAPVVSARIADSGSSKKWLVGSATALVCAAGLWGWGYSRGREELGPQRALYEQRLVAGETRVGEAEGQLKTARDELAFAHYRERLLEARTLLFRAAIDLEKRNFGIANKRLRSAADELKNLPIPDSANSALLALQRDVANTNLVVATDVEQQRTKVLELGERLDKLTPLANAESP